MMKENSEERRENLLNMLATGDIELLQKLDPNKPLVMVACIWCGAGYLLEGFAISVECDDTYENLELLGKALKKNKKDAYYIERDEYLKLYREIRKEVIEWKDLDKHKDRDEIDRYVSEQMDEMYLNADTDIYITAENFKSWYYDYNFFVECVNTVVSGKHKGTNWGDGGFYRYDMPNEGEVFGYKKYYGKAEEKQAKLQRC